jgi:hypothetical protein
MRTPRPCPDAAGTRRARYLEESVEDPTDRRDSIGSRGGARLRCYLGRCLPNIAETVETLEHRRPVATEGPGDGVGHVIIAESDLDGLEVGRESALQEIRRGGHILRRGPREELGQDLDQDVAPRRTFQPPEVLHELRETHNVSFRSGSRHFTGSRGERSTGQAAATRGPKRL